MHLKNYYICRQLKKFSMLTIKSIIKSKIGLLFLILIIAASCSTPLNELIYLNEIETGVTYVSGPVPEEYRIRPNDQLFIQVISDDPLNAAFLNLIDRMLQPVWS